LWSPAAEGHGVFHVRAVPAVCFWPIAFAAAPGDAGGRRPASGSGRGGRRANPARSGCRPPSAPHRRRGERGEHTAQCLLRFKGAVRQRDERLPIRSSVAKSRSACSTIAKPRSESVRPVVLVASTFEASAPSDRRPAVRASAPDRRTISGAEATASALPAASGRPGQGDLIGHGRAGRADAGQAFPQHPSRSGLWGPPVRRTVNAPWA
jgi:hypothetical protein